MRSPVSGDGDVTKITMVVYKAEFSCLQVVLPCLGPTCLTDAPRLLLVDRHADKLMARKLVLISAQSLSNST